MKLSCSQFENRILAYQKSLLLFAFSLTRDADNANDLVQETYLRALQYSHHFKMDTNMKAWLFRIMKNIFINDYRRGQLTKAHFDSYELKTELNIAETNQQFDPEKKLEHQEVMQKMKGLDAYYSKPLQMFVEGFHYKEIADELQLPIGTVKSRIFLGRKELANRLGIRA